jgi:hypothetical protein
MRGHRPDRRTANTRVEAPAIAAVLFDMDGVVTQTAQAHAVAWKRLFDDFLKSRADERGEAFEPFDIERDYREYVDGKPGASRSRRGPSSCPTSRPRKAPYGNASSRSKGWSWNARSSRSAFTIAGCGKGTSAGSWPASIACWSSTGGLPRAMARR